MIALTYQYKLRPNKQQEAEINQILDVCRSVYNYALRERKDWLSSKKSPINSCSIISEYIIPADTPYPSYNNQAKSLTIAKKTNPKLKSVSAKSRHENAQVLQQTLKTLDKAFSEMKSLGKGFPRFKKKLRSFVFPAMLKNCLGSTKVKLPQLGWIKIRQSRPYPEGMTAKQARIVKKASGYYLMITFTSSESVPDNPVGKVSLGLDAGIESFVATSTGQLIKSPKFLLSKLRELKLLQRRLKKKTIRSNNWFKFQNKIAKLHEKIANTRRDWHFKLAHKLCNLADNIFVENINFNSWSRGIVRKQSLDSGIGQFINEILPFVCWKRGKYYAKVDKNHTSQECPRCGHRQKKKLSQRSHNCNSCGYQINRDIAAAKVIRNRGLIAVGHTVNQNACGDGLAGVQLSLFDLLPS
ncbi:RNA-guided endonuclease TnpB family protein [Okeania sp. KiyG1]|uniref:RNA-guided endonuclease InsQ/TnpB family protein n=1 Tax=Okeania sp. KiyG1 TaxID=2720165 RepID=UPI0019236F3D|nr:RNA-guided endonuclease TnpB family protein [Okeania sp. KiyG1]GGA57572.1 hypothetical protein CYANOKiyG1_78650 [Okeania sp. KiyG1]